ncbi:MAG: hypothetical protein V3U02_10795, partial [Calditrichia bacterium]
MAQYKQTVWFRYNPATGAYYGIDKKRLVMLQRVKVLLILSMLALVYGAFRFDAIPAINLLIPIISGYMFTDHVQMRAGATPQTFDGNQTVRFNEVGKRLTGLSIGQSQSIQTTDEGFAIAVKLSENSGLTSKAPIFFMGWTMDSGPTTNHAAQAWPADYLGLDIGVAGNSTMRVDISSIAGAIQTGTHDVAITAHYDSGDTPDDILFAAAAASGVVAVKGGSYGYIT